MASFGPKRIWKAILEEESNTVSIEVIETVATI